MKFQGIGKIFLASVIGFSAAGFVVASESIQWAGGGSYGNVSARHDLRWAKPKVAGAVVTAEHSVEMEEPSSILQVQYDAFAQAMTPAQRDMIYPELRPKSNTPPAGATLVPAVPQQLEFPRPSSTPPRPTAQPKNESSAASSSSATRSRVNAAVLPEPKPAVLQTTELQSPDVQQLDNQPDRSIGIGSGIAPEPASRYGFNPTAFGANSCPDKAGFTSIREISYDIRPMSDQLPTECPLVTTPYSGRHFSRTCFQWKASALCTKAAYFEDVQLERNGHSVCPALEPVLSGARFFLTVPVLPYKMGLTPPSECVYTLGHYRVGNCAPHMLDPLPISIRAALFEGAAIGAGIALIP